MPFEVRDRLHRRDLRHLHRVGGDIGEYWRAIHRAGLRSGMPTDDHNSLLRCVVEDRLLLDGVAAADHDCVRLKRNRLAQPRSLPRNRALAVDLTIGPSEDVGCLLEAMRDAQNAPVAHVAGDVDDRLLRNRLGTARGSLPFVRARRRFLHHGLRVVDKRIGPRRTRDGGQGQHASRPHQNHSTFHGSSSRLRWPPYAAAVLLI